MTYKHNEPLLICEAGLHGDGDHIYYLHMIKEIRSAWSGWPRLAFKMQHWSEDGRWAQLIREMHGREPLKSVNQSSRGMLEIRAACQDAGILLMTTPHDVQSAHFTAPFVDMFKLGSHDATQPDLVDAVAAVGKPTVANVYKLTIPQQDGLQKKFKRLRMTSGVPAYPANATIDGNSSIGYSCHSVPSLISKHVLYAAPRCNTIEVHVTYRTRCARQLPGDMCVSMSLPDFLQLAEDVGAVWNNCK